MNAQTSTTLPINEHERQRIESAVQELERQSSAEVVPMLVAASDLYAGARWRFATLIALLVTYLAATVLQPQGWPLTGYLSLLIILLIMGLLSTSWSPLLRLVTDNSNLQEEVRQASMQRFFEYGLHSTRERNGILIYISLAEQRVEVLADAGIHAKVGDAFWQKLVDSMLPLVRQQRVADAILLGLDLLRDPLTQHFPRREGDANELTNQLIVH